MRWTIQCTHLGPFLGFAATGKVVTVEGATKLRMAGGKIVEHWGQWDGLGFLQTIGAWQAPGQAKAESAG